MKRILKAYGLLIAAVLLCAFIIQSCASGGSGNMTLDSGVDKKSAQATGGDAGYAESEPAWQQEALADPGWSQPYNESGSADGAVPSPTNEMLKEMSKTALAFDRDLEAPDSDSTVEPAASNSLLDPQKFEEWFLPKAYAQDNLPDQKYLIRTGSISSKVESYEDAEKQVGLIAGKHGGFISDSNSEVYGDESIEGWLRLRVPNESFDDVWAELLAIGEVTSKNTSTEDVGGQYVAQLSRLKNLSAERDTLEKMLEEALEVQRSRGLGEAYSILLDTQKRLSQVTGEMQATQDRINALADQITRSTITVELREVPQPKDVVKDDTFAWGFNETMGQGFKDLKIAARNFVNGVIYFLITMWTWFIPLLIIFFIGRWGFRKWIKPLLAKDAQKKPKPAAPSTGGDS